MPELPGEPKQIRVSGAVMRQSILEHIRASTSSQQRDLKDRKDASERSQNNFCRLNKTCIYIQSIAQLVDAVYEVTIRSLH